MTRPLERLGIDALEAHFGRTAITEDELLDLKDELEIRTTQRAKGLLDKVVERLSSMRKVKAAPSKPLVSAPTPKANVKNPVEVPVFVAPPPPARAIRAGMTAASIAADTQGSPKWAMPNTSAAMTQEQALRVLKVPVTASWEQIEKSRRELVARAQPDRLAGLAAEKRKALQDECRLVNAAYKTLLQKTA